MAQPSFNSGQPATKGVLGKIRSKIIYWNIFTPLAKSVGIFFVFLRARTAVSFWLFAALSGFSLVGIFTHNIWIISLAGLIWMLVWLAFFGVSVFIHWLAVNMESLFSTKEAPEIRSWIDEQIDNFLLFARKLTFSAAGISISLGHIFTKAHIVAAVNAPDDSFTKSWISWVFIAGAPLIGRTIDWFNSRLNKMEANGGIMYLLGIIQFYATFTILITGLIGGKPAMAAVYTIVRRPISLYEDLFVVGYINSYSQTVYHDIGGTWFISIYLIFPAYLTLAGHIGLLKIKNGQKVAVPSLGLHSLRFAGVVFLVIGLIVSWHEGWVVQTIIYLLGLLNNLYHFIFG